MHQNPCVGALRTASWTVIAHPDSHLDALRAHLGAQGLHLGARGVHFGAPGQHFGSSWSPFSGSWDILWQHFLDLATICSIV